MASSLQCASSLLRLGWAAPGNTARKLVPLCTATLASERTSSLNTKFGSWTWKYGSDSLNINLEEHGLSKNSNSSRDMLFLPTISDVSTTEEWEAVVKELVSDSSWRAVTVDWPGFGLSDRPPLDYTADLMENFLVDFVQAPDGPLGSRPPPVIIGAGHAATIAVKALAKGCLNAAAVVAVAPTWAGPLPIVFGRSSQAKYRYELLRNTLRAPGVGWVMYNILVSSPGNIRKQYESHVYAKASNVTHDLVKSRLALTKRKGARFAPAAFLTGKLDPCETREEFVTLFDQLNNIPTLVIISKDSPKRSKAEMEALSDSNVRKLSWIPGALLPQEEFPQAIAAQIRTFLAELSL